MQQYHFFYHRIIRPLFLILIIHSFGYTCFAQDTLSLKKAVYYASHGQDENAKEICYTILQKDPSQAPAKILLGKLYSWEKKFDTARSLLKEVIKKYPENQAALNSLINVELWSNNPDQALIYCNKGINLNPKSEDFLLKKAKVFDRQKKDVEAYRITEELLKTNPNNKEAGEFLKYLKQKKGKDSEKNGVGISYSHDSFNKKYSPWNYVSVYLFHKGKWGAISGGVNYANRFNRNALQYELSVYPKISSKVRAFVNAGYSSAIIFPNYKFGASVYYKIFKKTELELGGRYFNFTILSAPIIAYTGSVSTYYKKFWVSFRPYIIPQKVGVDQSYYLTVRYYLPNPKNNITLTLNTGLSPQDYFDPALRNSFKITSHTRRARIAFQTIIFSPKNILKASFGYEKRDYLHATRDRITMGIGLERLF